MGFGISTTGLRMDPAKLSTIAEWPYPTDIADLRRFLGFTNFYRRFIPRFSAEVSRLTDLTKKDSDVVLGLTCEETKNAFLSLIEAFTSAPFLKHFDFNAKRVLQVDASAYAFSAILTQPNKSGALVPVCYYSKKLSPAESRWQTHDQELGAIVAAFKEWQLWLMGSNNQIFVFSDHANLQYFMEGRSLTPRQSRWAAFLSSFNFMIMHTPGKLNPADPASQQPNFIDGAPSEALILFQSITGAPVNAIQLSDDGEKFNLSFSTPTLNFLALLRSRYDSNATIQQMSSKVSHTNGFRLLNDTWWYWGRVYVPSSCREEILTTYHARPVSGHWGVAKTVDLMSRTFGWKGMQMDKLKFISVCRSCQQVNRDLRPRQGSMMPLPVPERPWSTIGIDFIVKLPVSSGFDSVMVIVNHYSKALHFIAARETWSSADMADAFIDKFFRLHGLPDKIVSDRGSVFMSSFWSGVCHKLGITSAPSIAFHPQTVWNS